MHHSIELFHQPTLMHNFLYSLKLVDEIILYYDGRSKKHQMCMYVCLFVHFCYIICHLGFTIPKCLQNSIIWFLPVKHTFILYLKYYSGNMFRLAIESPSGPYIKIQILILSTVNEFGIP